MKILYLECNMGVSGDMLMSSLIELLPNPQFFLDKMRSLNIPNVKIDIEKVSKCGILGTHTHIIVDGIEEVSQDVCLEEHQHKCRHQHSSTTIGDIEQMVSHLNLSERVRQDVLSVYHLIAEAESHVHGKNVQEIHFHEVGTIDAITDIVGVCLLMEMLSPQKVICSPINTGYGQVRCIHGVLPIPAPATAYIIRNIPIYSGNVQGELCTPTGASLVKHFATEFKQMPTMCVEKIGYGMGSKDFPEANCLRAMIGETLETSNEISELQCNLDDMSPENIAFAQEVLLSNGALDVFTTPIVMKKGRLATLLTCLCSLDTRDSLVNLIFKHTSTIGIREVIKNRYTLTRREILKDTSLGSIKVKVSNGFGVEHKKIEYDDISKMAKEKNISIEEIKNILYGNNVV
ncbi:MAG: nickel pincer cofactor biosynthesis protein LarC [Oscillospiraceae bacterium]